MWEWEFKFERRIPQLPLSSPPQALKARVNEVADRLFAAFSKRVGVASIREWEEQHAAFEEYVASRKAELLQQVGLRSTWHLARQSCCNIWV